jgi:hypothetical protein
MRNVFISLGTQSIATGANLALPQPSFAINWLERELPDPADQREYAQERCVVAITEGIGEAMERAGINRTQLAEKLGYTKGHVSKVLSGAHNMTLRTLGEFLWACGVEVRDLAVAPLGILQVSHEDATEWHQTVVTRVSTTSDVLPACNVLQSVSEAGGHASANSNLSLAA